MLIYFQNACNCWVGVRLQPGAWSSSQVFQVGSRDPTIWVNHLLSPRMWLDKQLAPKAEWRTLTWGFQRASFESVLSIYFNGRPTERERKRQGSFHLLSHSLTGHSIQGMVKARNPELQPGIPQGWQASTWTNFLCLPRLITVRN